MVATPEHITILGTRIRREKHHSAQYGKSGNASTTMYLYDIPHGTTYNLTARDNEKVKWMGEVRMDDGNIDHIDASDRENLPSAFDITERHINVIPASAGFHVTFVFTPNGGSPGKGAEAKNPVRDTSGPWKRGLEVTPKPADVRVHFHYNDYAIPIQNRFTSYKNSDMDRRIDVPNVFIWQLSVLFEEADDLAVGFYDDLRRQGLSK